MIGGIWHSYTIHENAAAYKAAVFPLKAYALPARFDERSQHYEVRKRLRQ
jgi:hypothetical protein